MKEEWMKEEWMKEEWMKMLFGRFYIKNYYANYNSYFPLKVKGLTGKSIFLHAQHRDCLWS